MSGVRPPSPVMRYHVRPRGRSRKPSTARAYEKSPWYPVPAALLAQLVEHLHGKEGVDGSSPSEGFAKFLLISSFCPDCWRRVRASVSTERPPTASNAFREAWKPCRGAALRGCGPTSTQRPRPFRARAHP